MRLVDAYRRIHPRTSDSDESTAQSTQTNETELSPLLGDEALAWVRERVASAHESEAHDDLSTSTPPPPPYKLTTHVSRQTTGIRTGAFRALVRSARAGPPHQITPVAAMCAVSHYAHWGQSTPYRSRYGADGVLVR